MPRQSVAADTRRQLGRPARHTRQKHSGAVVITARIQDRKRLCDLHKWVVELHETHGKSFRWIAMHTTRGPGSHGYWQAIHKRDHLKKKPRVRPCEHDWLDLRALARVVRSYTGASNRLFDKALAFDKAVAAMNRAAIELIEVARSQ